MLWKTATLAILIGDWNSLTAADRCPSCPSCPSPKLQAAQACSAGVWQLPLAFCWLTRPGCPRIHVVAPADELTSGLASNNGHGIPAYRVGICRTVGNLATRVGRDRRFIARRGQLRRTRAAASDLPRPKATTGSGRANGNVINGTHGYCMGWPKDRACVSRTIYKCTTSKYSRTTAVNLVSSIVTDRQYTQYRQSITSLPVYTGTRVVLYLGSSSVAESWTDTKFSFDKLLS
eukprot:SAG31_NODE_3275_length_4474_cov_17.108114_1_plen_233_part_00